MAINLASVISSLGKSDVRLERRAPGSVVKGAYVPGAVTASIIRASIQPAGRTTILKFEGVRADDLIDIYTATALKGADDAGGAVADRIVWNGDTYEIQMLDQWASTGQGAYVKAVGKRLRTVVP